MIVAGRTWRESPCPVPRWCLRAAPPAAPRSPTSFAAAITPSAMTSHFMMPPKMLTRMPSTFGSDRMILNASVTFSLRRAAADVEEVGRLAAVELDDVHRRHREAGAVDHAADVAVERDVVQVVFRRFDLLGVLLRRGRAARRCRDAERARCRRMRSWRRGISSRPSLVTTSGLISSIAISLATKAA